MSAVGHIVCVEKANILSSVCTHATKSNASHLNVNHCAFSSNSYLDP